MWYGTSIYFTFEYFCINFITVENNCLSNLSFCFLSVHRYTILTMHIQYDYILI